MSGIVIINLDTDLPPDAFGNWLLGAFLHLSPEHIDMIRRDGFACYMDEMQKIVAHMTQQWADNVGNLFNLSFGMRPVFDVEKEDERHGGAQRVFIGTRRRRMQDEISNDPILRGLFREGRHEHHRRN